MRLEMPLASGVSSGLRKDEAGNAPCLRSQQWIEKG